MLPKLLATGRIRFYNTILKYAIVVLAALNLLFYFFGKSRPINTQFLSIPKKKIASYPPPPLRLPQELKMLPPPPPDIPYEQIELDTAIKFLNLPTWSRGYIACNDSRSEITCSTVVRAYRLIKGWEDNISSLPLEQRKYFVLEHPVKGMGNKMSTDIIGFTMALMSNRTVIVTSNQPIKDGPGVRWQHAYEFPPSVLVHRNQLPLPIRNKSENFPKAQTSASWCCFDVEKLVLSEEQFVGMDDLIYGSMVYANTQTANFALKNFGIHAAYFVGNYFSRFPEESIQLAQEFLSAVPKGKTVLGCHIRYHRAGQYYSHGLNQTMPIVREELEKRIKANPNIVLAVATDNLTIKYMMLEEYKERIVMTDALRRPDKDHLSAMIDMALLLGSDELFVTYRSTFSWIIVTKTGRNAWWIEKEAPHCFPGGNSQSMGVSMLYHWRDTCDWRTNDRLKFCGTDEHRKTLEFFYDYIAM